MSIRNEDRHGLSNLQHERVKSFDKLHVPPFLIFLLVGIPVVYCFSVMQESDEDSSELMRKKALLKAVRKTQKITEYGEEES